MLDVRFAPGSRVTPFERTRRKDLALLARQRREREALPLFAAEIGEGQPDVESVMAGRAVAWPAAQQRTRDRRAAAWREGRARFYAHGANTRAALRAAWNECPYPGDPAYFGDFLTSFERGRIDLDRPPWRCHAALKPRTTPDASTFDEAFRVPGRNSTARGRGFGPVGTGWWGNFGEGLLVLVVVTAASDDASAALEVRPVATADELARVRAMVAAIDAGATVEPYRFEDPEREDAEWRRRARLAGMTERRA